MTVHGPPFHRPDAVRTAWEPNLSTSEALIDQLLNDSAYARSLAPTVVDVANTILAADPAIINAVIDADAFGGTVPAEWAGKTYAYLANFIKKAAKETQYADDNGSLDTANNALNNPAAKKLGGALLALADQAHVDLVMNNIWYLRLVKGLELRALDWAYLAGKFSLDAGAVAAINDALANTTAGPDSVPVFGDDFQAVAALDAGTLYRYPIAGGSGPHSAMILRRYGMPPCRILYLLPAMTA